VVCCSIFLVKYTHYNYCIKWLRLHMTKN
jgi:hypothetical protein